MFGKNENGADNAAASRNEKKIDRETAEAEFIRYCENNRFECDESAMNDEERESFSDIKNRIVESCMQGRVIVDGTSVDYILSDFSPEGFKGETVTIKRPTGNAFSAMDGYDDKRSVHKLHSFISAMTGKDVKYFSKIDIEDWKFFNAVATLFLSL